MTNYHDYAGNVVTPALKQYDSSTKLEALFKAGLKETGRSTDLSKITLNYLTTSGDDTGTFLKQQYKSKLGINVKITTAPDDASFIADRNANKYDLLANAWNGDYDDPSTFLNLWVSTGGFQKFFGTLILIHNRLVKAFVIQCRNIVQDMLSQADIHIR